MLKKVIKNQSSDLAGMCKSTTFAPAFRESGSAMIDMMNEASVLPKKKLPKNLAVKNKVLTFASAFEEWKSEASSLKY